MHYTHQGKPEEKTVMINVLPHTQWLLSWYQCISKMETR